MDELPELERMGTDWEEWHDPGTDLDEHSLSEEAAEGPSVTSIEGQDDWSDPPDPIYYEMHDEWLDPYDSSHYHFTPPTQGSARAPQRENFH